MSENRWTEDDFVQLARPRMMAAANPGSLPNQLFEFFSEALAHYDAATPEGKAYIDRAMAGLTKIFELDSIDPDTPETQRIKSSVKCLEVLHEAWKRKCVGEQGT